ncbi:DUF3500 domain-containing protein [Cognatilysobacter bugurensis]|uniref:DUF3500 domain-containing protein n=1 Tax=Cognatilysobacter bugurensis TaxID=543356 RepID=A0A918T104_9GAMM|nr:DUF3500 domain-containing protein [Lysobacter bugurensis]GHA83141.1 hypothetical protein GCM10007067_21570 [Lysobacter bugurensis]
MLQDWWKGWVSLAAAASVVACSQATPVAARSTSDAAPARGASGTDASASSAAARAFLATLSERQQSIAVHDFADDERTAWTYLPQGRAGLPLEAMNAAQRAAAFELLGTGLSERGTQLARGVVELEGTLRDVEKAAGSFWAFRRDPELYYLALFGAPRTPPWAWRFEGHHLSVNATALGPHGQIIAPLFVGANPARVPSGPRRGFRLLAAEEDLAFELLRMLDAPRRARAVIGATTPGDIVTGDDPVVRAMAFAGLPAADMTVDQQRQLRRLLEWYAGRMADAAATKQLQRIDEAGFGQLHFAWAGAQQPGAPHYYRVHGPTVLVEYDNSQDGANHIHTVWRDLENDFGGDLLRRHYASGPHPH